MGSRYVINHHTKDLYYDQYSPDLFVDYCSNSFNVKNETINSDSVYTNRPDEPAEIKEEYLAVDNAHWLLSYGVYVFPTKSMKKAHLWHLFLNIIYRAQ